MRYLFYDFISFVSQTVSKPATDAFKLDNALLPKKSYFKTLAIVYLLAKTLKPDVVNEKNNGSFKYSSLKLD